MRLALVFLALVLPLTSAVWAADPSQPGALRAEVYDFLVTAIDDEGNRSSGASLFIIGGEQGSVTGDGLHAWSQLFHRRSGARPERHV